MLQNLMLRIVPLKAGDGPRVLLSFLNFFLLIAAYYILKPVRSSLFLKHWTAAGLPIAYLITAVVIFGIVGIYSQLTHRLTRHQLLFTVYGLFLPSFALFWWLFDLSPKPVAMAFYVWVSIFNVMAVTLFWSYTNDIFNPMEGKRYYGFIGTGGILGSIVGSFATGYLAHAIGTENLLWVSCALLILVVFGHVAVWYLGNPAKKSSAEPPKTEVAVKSPEGGFSLVVHSKYLLSIGLMVILLNFFASLLDFEFNKVVEKTILRKDQLTSYFGMIFGIINTMSFAIQFFMTNRIHQRLGVGRSVVITPLVSLMAASAYAFSPILNGIAALKVVSSSFEYSLNQASKELLYLPLGREVKYKAKAFIDMAFYRVGDALSALAILFLNSVVHLSLPHYRFINLGVLVVYLGVALYLSRGYLVALRDKIQWHSEPKPNDVDSTLAEMAPGVKSDDFPNVQAVEWEIRAQGKRYYMALACVAEIEKEHPEQAKTLEEEANRMALRLFRLISLIHSPEDVFHSVNSLYLHKNSNDIIAEELLDNVLRYPIRYEVLPLFDPDATREDKIKHGRGHWKLALPDIKDFLKTLFPHEEAETLAHKAWHSLIQST